MKKLQKISAGIVVCGLLMGTVAAQGTVPTAEPTQQQTVVLSIPDFTSVVEKTQNAVVNIRTEAWKPNHDQFQGFRFGDDNPDDMFRFFFGDDFPFPDQMRPRFKRHAPDENRSDDERDSARDKSSGRYVPRGVGTGFIVSKDGYIMTNHHVVDDAEKILVTLPDSKKELEAKLIGSDQRTDIAVLKVSSKEDLPVLEMGNSDGLKKGQWVLAIGSPFELENTVTSGIVSAIHRDTGSYLRFIQTDVAVNPGNSGGPLIDLNGRVVGVNSQIISRTGGYQGISFSIPINDAVKVYEQIKTDGKVHRGRIGVMVGEISEDVAKALGLPDSHGAMIQKVMPNEPADQAGLHEGDVITGVNGHTLEKWSDLSRIVGETKVNDKVRLSVWRKGKTLTLAVPVKEPKEDKKSTKTSDHTEKKINVDVLGLSVEDIDQETKKEARIESGVRVAEVKGMAKRWGIKKGDLLLQVNNEAVKDVASFETLTKDLPKGQPVALLLKRGPITIWLTVSP
ncbi:MAG: Do family serine endopeptidase [Alcaligenaceae bacterium]|nr:Do family serine endopeptidase [Alcaligenaceae bacterium]